MRLVKFILIPTVITIVFLVVVYFLQGELSREILVVSPIIAFLFILSNLVLQRFTSDSEKFPLAFLAGTGIQFFSVLCIYLALFKVKIADLKFVLVSLSCFFFIQLLGQAYLMIKEVNK